jgi:hypothetical protein
MKELWSKDPDGMDRYYMNSEGRTVLALKYAFPR